MLIMDSKEQATVPLKHVHNINLIIKKIKLTRLAKDTPTSKL